MGAGVSPNTKQQKMIDKALKMRDSIMGAVA